MLAQLAAAKQGEYMPTNTDTISNSDTNTDANTVVNANTNTYTDIN